MAFAKTTPATAPQPYPEHPRQARRALTQLRSPPATVSALPPLKLSPSPWIKHRRSPVRTTHNLHHRLSGYIKQLPQPERRAPAPERIWIAAQPRDVQRQRQWHGHDSRNTRDRHSGHLPNYDHRQQRRRHRCGSKFHPDGSLGRDRTENHQRQHHNVQGGYGRKLHRYNHLVPPVQRVKRVGSVAQPRDVQRQRQRHSHDSRNTRDWNRRHLPQLPSPPTTVLAPLRLREFLAADGFVWQARHLKSPALITRVSP